MQVSNSIKKVQTLHHCRKLMKISCQKGAGTKMLKCLIGNQSIYPNIYLSTFYNLHVYLFQSPHVKPEPVSPRQELSSTKPEYIS